jgi:probable F420-dependent oxidoreductase
MRYGLSLMNFDDFADARRVASLAAVAEEAGWDALLVWDHLGFAWGTPSGDPWTLVTAAALATDRLLVGTDVAVIARERPLTLARTLTTIDRLSGGRLVLGVGIGGAPDEYRKAGEPVDPRERAALTDEMLDVLRPLLAGETVTHRGPALVVDDVTLAPLPVQARLPVWVGGGSPGARRRAARHDGWIPVTQDEEGRPCLTPDDVRAALAEIRADRAGAGDAADAPFTVGIHGETPGPGADGAAIVRPWADAGATWWLEMLHGWRGSTAELFARVEAGPPRA